MALDYDGANNGLFTHIGKLIKHVNLLGTDASNLDADEEEILTAFEAGDQRDKVSSLLSSFEGLRQSHVGLRTLLAEIAGQRLQDRATVINELDLPTDSLSEVLFELINRMVDDGESVDASVVTIGAVSPDSGNEGNGTVLTSKVLDGVTEPGRSLPAHPEYNGRDSELSVSETMVVTCISDSYSDGSTAGEEQFQWNGEISSFDRWGLLAEGSGTGPGLSTVNAGSIIRNPNFENFTTNAPDDWDVDDGTAGTHIDDETATAANIYRGSASLKFIGDGSEETIQISQTIPANQLIPRKRYLFTIRYKASAVDTDSQALTIRFEGTGYTAADSEKIEIAGDDFDTDWTLKHFWINIPAAVPSDFELVIKVTGTLSSGKTIYFDSIGFSEAVYHNGIAIGVVAGNTPFVRGDRFSFTVTNGKEGTVQEFFRRAFGIQLPSKADGSETIPDSLAE